MALAAAVGCYTGNAVDTNREVLADGQGTAGDTAPLPDGGALTAAATGLPCDIHQLLQEQCVSCHGKKPSAPMSLITYEDLAAPSPSIPTKTVAEVVLDRLKSKTRPMPPFGQLPDEDIAKWSNWLMDGMQRGTCGATPAPGKVDAGNPQNPHPLPVPEPVGDCSSGKFYDQDGPPSTVMNPGLPCLTCHGNNNKRLSFAGTVYSASHEPDLCNGVTGNGNTRVLLIDANGDTHEMAVNAVGNFNRVTTIPLPYRAMVIQGLKTRMMNTPQTSGDCNGCHTQSGANGAPGRIMAP
jgi:mono/diheme cytochrome c family protein